MSRKSDEELLEEIEARRKLKKAEEEAEEDNPQYTEDDSNPSKVQTQIVEREVNLSLINDKLNFIISKVQNIK